MRVLTDRRLWSSDRLHLSPDGHHRVALLACEVAGLAVRGDWRAPLMDQPGRAGVSGWFASRRSDLEWLTEHAAPYVSRRLHGVSSGDGLAPKRPHLSHLGIGPAVRAPALAPVASLSVESSGALAP
jgi:hypothetical protein